MQLPRSPWSLTDGITATLVLDGKQQLARIDRYWLVGLATMALSLLLSVVAARFVAGRFGVLLDGIAARIDDGTGAAAAGATDLPVELIPIATRLSSMLAAVRKRSDEAKVFTTGLAHELRSPIQNLIGEVEVALMSPRSDEHYRSLLGRQVQELHHFARAVDNLLFLCSAAEPSRMRTCEAFDLAAMVELRLAGERALAKSGEVTVRIEVAGDCTVIADLEAVMRAVRNMVNNAVKWSPPGAAVLVTIDGREDPIVVEVHDGGPGIPTSDRERVFEPFLPGAVADGQRAGFGLGLAMTRAAARQHRGSVAIAESQLGGALVRLSLPRRSTENEACSAAQSVMS